METSNENEVREIVNDIQSKTTADELTEYIKEEMQKLRVNSMTVGLKMCARMILDVCENERLGMREKLREIKRLCKTGLEGKEK